MITISSREKIVCRYTNSTTRFQIIRISNIPHWFLERSVLPHGTIVFEAYRGAQLEVHTGTMVSSILADVIACERLMEISYPTVERVCLIPQPA